MASYSRGGQLLKDATAAPPHTNPFEEIEVSEIDFTAARVLAVAARDAAVRLKEELWRIGICESSGVAAGVADAAVDLEERANAAIGLWTRAADVQPPFRFADFPPLDSWPPPSQSGVYSPPRQPWHSR